MLHVQMLQGAPAQVSPPKRKMFSSAFTANWLCERQLCLVCQNIIVYISQNMQSHVLRMPRTGMPQMLHRWQWEGAASVGEGTDTE